MTIVTASLQPDDTRSIAGICAMLGVPAAHRHQFAQWAAELADGGSSDALEYYVDLMVADRCYRLGDDLLSQLISTGVAGEDLTIDEIQLAVRAMLTLAHRAENAAKRP